MMIRATIFLLAAAVPLVRAETYTFTAGQSAEFVANLDMSSPESDWAEPRREAALATVTLDGRLEQHVMLFAGPKRHTYRVFLGSVLPGDHELVVERNERYSAPNSRFEVHRVTFESFAPGDPYFDILARSPVLYARANTVMRFSDIPLVVYCERVDGFLQYTVIFSNEDGGTSTRALMARWGRTTDIEYVYRVKPDGTSELVQGRNHQEVRFQGQHFGSHPLLIPVTDNNMVSGEATSPIRYQIPPVSIELKGHSREEVMDQNAITYQVMAKELIREGKIRPYGLAAGEKISDPRNYLYLEYQATNTNGAISVSVRRKSDRTAHSSSLGRIDYAIARDGWVRTTVELPPATKADALWEIVFDCIVAPPSDRNEPLPHSAECQVQQISKMFFLEADYKPGPNLWKGPGDGKLRSGESLVFLGW
jgi:hypothetical protein